MSAVFDQMTFELSRETFRDYGATKISQEDFDTFYKEYIFQKLKGIKLGEAFAKKFNIRDRVLYTFSNDEDVLTHIAYCKYVE
jgi:hypothetical protein